MVPGGIRIGTNALTSRSMTEKDMETIGEFLHRVVEIAQTLQKEAGSKLLKDFIAKASSGEGEGRKQLLKLADDVKAFATSFPLPGVPDTSVIKQPAGAH